MKVSESEIESGRCDFCMVNEPKHTINGGLWWICDKCMETQYARSVCPGEWGEEE